MTRFSSGDDRTDCGTVEGVRAKFTERTLPPGTFKALFFQDLFQNQEFPGFLLTMRVFYDHDTYPALPGGIKALDYAVSV